MRCITWGRIRDTSTRDLLVSTGYLSVHQLRAYLTLTSLHTAKLQGCPKWVSTKQIPMMDTRTTKGQLKVIPTRLNCREESYFPSAVKLYNSLPGDYNSLEQKKFKKELSNCGYGTMWTSTKRVVMWVSYTALDQIPISPLNLIVQCP